MKNISTEAIIGSIVILVLVIVAFLWVMFKPETQSKYHPPYKYYSGDKPDYKRR
jgi:HJR/Mrr/RecB family endonuclease